MNKDPACSIARFIAANGYSCWPITLRGGPSTDISPGKRMRETMNKGVTKKERSYRQTKASRQVQAPGWQQKNKIDGRNNQ